LGIGQILNENQNFIGITCWIFSSRSLPNTNLFLCNQGAMVGHYLRSSPQRRLYPRVSPQSRPPVVSGASSALRFPFTIPCEFSRRNTSGETRAKGVFLCHDPGVEMSGPQNLGSCSASSRGRRCATRRHVDGPSSHQKTVAPGLQDGSRYLQWRVGVSTARSNKDVKDAQLICLPSARAPLVSAFR
jgi:hypothetical protein